MTLSVPIGQVIETFPLLHVSKLLCTIKHVNSFKHKGNGHTSNWQYIHAGVLNLYQSSSRKSILKSKAFCQDFLIFFSA